MKINNIILFINIALLASIVNFIGCKNESKRIAETPVADTTSVESQIEDENQNSSTQSPERGFRGTATAIVQRAYFYNYAELSSKRRDYIVEGQSAEIQREKGDFIFTRFVYAGKETRGWMFKGDFLITEGSTPTFIDGSSSHDYKSSGKMPDNRVDSKEDESIDGSYSFKSPDVESNIIIRGNKWFGTHVILGQSDIETGFVKGKDLYDDSGFIVIGNVEGGKLYTILMNRRVIMT